MTDHVLNLSGSCDKGSFSERFATCEYGPVIWGQGAVNKNPEGNAAVFSKLLVLEVHFAAEVG